MQYGGFLTRCQQQGAYNDLIARKACVRGMCESVFAGAELAELQAGCLWYADWYEAADNPAMRYRPITCPAQLSGKSGTTRSPSDFVLGAG